MKLPAEYSYKKKSSRQVVTVVQWQNLTVRRGKVILSTMMAGTLTDTKLSLDMYLGHSFKDGSK